MSSLRAGANPTKAALLVSERQLPRALIEALLYQRHRVVELHSMESALLHLNQTIPDLVVVGAEHLDEPVARLLRRLHTMALKVVVVTEHAALAGHARELGVLVRSGT